MTPHWYFITTYYCPVCGRDDSGRERRFGPRPEAYGDRHSFSEYYDWCQE